jgi:cell division protein FtsQ
VSKHKLDIKKIMFTIMWCAIGVAGIVLLQAAVRSQNVKKCREVQIDISGVNNNFFIDKADVLAIIKNFVGGNPVGRTLESFSLRDIESNLEKDVWIKNAELFFDNNDVLQVSVDEREPAARLFSVDGNTFYIDSSLKILPLSEKFSARLPVFTGFPHSSNTGMRAADSSLLRAVLVISEQLQADSFLMAMVDQVDITAQRSFEMIPKIGNQVIVFGDAADAPEKFNKLKLFYKKVITTTGWNRYSVINLQYKDQVVARIKGAEDKSADSVRTLQIMQLIAERAARQAEDSVQTFIQDSEKNTADSTLIQQSIERDEQETDDPVTQQSSMGASTENTGAAIVKPVAIKPATLKPEASKPAIIKPLTTKPTRAVVKPKAITKPAAKPAGNKPKPKAVMGG